MLGVSRDISERRQSAEALKKSEENYRLLAENIADVIWIINVDQNKITYCSSSVERLTGFTAEETKKQSLEELLTPDSVEIAMQRTEMIVHDFHINKNEHKTWFNQYKQRCRQGGWKWIETAVNCRLNENGETELLGVSRDIADRKKVEIELDARNRELKEMNLAKDKLFSIIAHDLRSPFNGFLGLLQTMESEFQSMSLEQILKYVRKLGVSAHNLYQLLENLLEWSRLQRGLVTAQPTLFSLRSVAKLNCEVANDTAIKKEIVIECMIPDQLVVYADKAMVDGILRNLISNAIKFSRHGGKIKLNAREINDGYVEVSVADNGIGMTGEMMGQLFQLDVITGRTGTDNEPSCGLGLILVKEFVEKNNGQIRVESAEEVGSTFRFTLPIRPALCEN